MKRRIVSAALLAVALGVFGAAVLPAAHAGIDVDLGASFPIGDNGRLFFNISSRYFGYEPMVVEHWGVRYTNPDDLAVSLFISRQCGRSPDVIFALRRQGLSWWDVGLRTGVPMDAWFVPVQRDPGPPYGKAYGHWRKHRENPKYMVVLGDADLRNLVAVRMAHEYYGVPVDDAMRWRASGSSVREVMVREYNVRHGKQGGEKEHGEKGEKHGHGQGNGKNDHGNGQGHANN